MPCHTIEFGVAPHSGAVAHVSNVLEIKFARELYKEFYFKYEAFSVGKKKFGICYRPDTEYDMEKYSEAEVSDGETKFN